MLSNLSHLDLSGFFVPGGNGLPDLYIHANDPADWVTMQIAARKPSDATSTTVKDVATTATVGASASAMPDWLKRLSDSLLSKFPNPQNYFKGAAIAAVLAFLAVALIVLGAYQLTRD